MGGTRRQVPDVYQRACPTQSATNATVAGKSFYLYHGDKDVTVSCCNLNRFAAHLQEVGAAFVESYLLEGSDHLSAQQFNQENVRRIHDFLRDKLHVPKEDLASTNAPVAGVEEVPLGGSYVL